MSLFLCTDVTAVKLITINGQDLVLAGIGSYVNIFDKNTKKRIKRQQVLKGQKIYGFVPDERLENILVFGGKQFTVFSIGTNSDDNIIIDVLFESVLCDDWLHSAIWQSNETIAVLTAHNTVQVWNITEQRQTCKHCNSNNSILYSGLLVPLDDGMLVFAGTVFSQVIIHIVGENKPVHTLTGHEGVIFSMAYDHEAELIASTSDDRTLRVWKPKTPSSSVTTVKQTQNYWRNIEIICKYKVYGHQARVMRCAITRECVISVGEDSAVCFWDFKGKLVKKIMNQNSGIWSVDAGDTDAVTGGSDGRVVLHRLAATQMMHKEIDIIAQRIVFTAKGNILTVCANNDITYYDCKADTNTFIYTLTHGSTYKQLTISHCKQIMAVADMCGNLAVFLEDCKLNTVKLLLAVKLDLKVLSIHFTSNRYLVFGCDKGHIEVLALNGNNIIVKDTFVLPNCKERWLTAAEFGANTFIFGDRCGNLHFYKENEMNPLKSIRKVHGCYGPTSVFIRDNKIITTGRDGSVKYFSIGQLKHLHTINVDFQWVEKFINNDLICGFRERVFIVYDIRSNKSIVEIPCGGGHRSWDVKRYFTKDNYDFNEMIKLVYLKNSTLHDITVRVDDVSKNIMNGTHIKEINCLQVIGTSGDVKLIVSGGEDTSVRISTLDMADCSISEKITYRHLSSVRCLKILPMADNRLLLVSAGGRAHICIKILTIDRGNNEVLIEIEHVIDYLIKGSDKDRRKGRNWRECLVDFDPETRIMDIEVFHYGNDYFVVAGCSDSLVKVFKCNPHERDVNLEVINDIQYHKTCILRTKRFEYDSRQLLATTSTVGEVFIWDVRNEQNLHDSALKPIFSTNTNKNGINDIHVKTLDEQQILLATCGDDNSIHLVILLEEDNTFKITHKLVNDKFHSSLISGVLLMDNYLLSVSIDQRVTLSRWEVDGPKLESHFLYQTFSDVADIHGLDIIEQANDSTTIIVYGKGVEVIKIPMKRNIIKSSSSERDSV